MNNPALQITSPLAAAVISVDVKLGDQVAKGQPLVNLESMKMQTLVTAPEVAVITAILVASGDTIQAGQLLFEIEATSATSEPIEQAVTEQVATGNLLEELQTQLAYSSDTMRPDAEFGTQASQVAVIVNDYSVLAGTQGYFHHKKIDRILDQAGKVGLPVVMYTEGGGGRPGDTDVKTQIAGLDVPTFARWASLSGQVPLIAVNNGYCFAGNAALFGCADIRIATKTSWIGMAGPAMIEGGGLGSFAPTEIGPIDIQTKNGVVDLVADNESHATQLAQQCLGYFQGDKQSWDCADQAELHKMMPLDRRFVYDIRSIIKGLVDTDSFIELSQPYGPGIVTGFIRIEGVAMGLIANDCRVLGGAIDAEAADKAARFISLCDQFSIPLLSLCDTPGFMVGPASEEQAAVRRMAKLFIAGAKISVPLVTIFLRKGYGLGAMAMAGGSFHHPRYSAAWPAGEFGAMGLEGAVRLGFKKELEAETDKAAREALFNKLVDSMYQRGKATEAAAHLEIDAVIDPADTRGVIVRALGISD